MRKLASSHRRKGKKRVESRISTARDGSRRVPAAGAAAGGASSGLQAAAGALASFLDGDHRAPAQEVLRAVGAGVQEAMRTGQRVTPTTSGGALVGRKMMAAGGGGGGGVTLGKKKQLLSSASSNKKKKIVLKKRRSVEDDDDDSEDDDNSGENDEDDVTDDEDEDAAAGIDEGSSYAQALLATPVADLVTAEDLLKYRSLAKRRIVIERMALREHIRELERRRDALRGRRSSRDENKKERRELAKYITALEAEQKQKHNAVLHDVNARLAQVEGERYARSDLGRRDAYRTRSKQRALGVMAANNGMYAVAGGSSTYNDGGSSMMGGDQLRGRSGAVIGFDSAQWADGSGIDVGSPQELEAMFAHLL